MKKSDIVEVIKQEYKEAVDKRKVWNRIMVQSIMEKYGRIEFEEALERLEFISSIEYLSWRDCLSKCQTIENLAEKMGMALQKW